MQHENIFKNERSDFPEAYLHQRGKFCGRTYQILQLGHHTLCLIPGPSFPLGVF